MDGWMDGWKWNFFHYNYISINQKINLLRSLYRFAGK